jgi:hypothetical protein
MIVCAPDMSPDVASRLGVEPCVLATPDRRVPLERGIKVLADVGLAGAKRGVDAATYLWFIRRVRPAWAIAPDVFGDFKATLSNWHRYSPIIAKFAAPILVAQEFYRPRVLDAVLDLRGMGLADKVALPMRMHHDISCSREPRRCAERAERALRALCGAVEHVHLLGPSLRAVRILRGVLAQCEGQGTAVSFDTVAYRRAPNNQVKKALGGRWMPRDSREAVVMLEAWLRQALPTR